MVTLPTESPVEDLRIENPELRCAAWQEHGCTEIARWLSRGHGGGRCNENGKIGVLWCDARYRYWKEVQWNLGCMCHTGPCSTWNVMSL